MFSFNPLNVAKMQLNKEALFNAEIPNELAFVVTNSFRDACLGNTNQFMYNIDTYLKHEPISANLFYTGEFDYLTKNASTFGLKQELIDGLDKYYVATLGVLHNYVCVGIDCTTEDFRNALYTRNDELIKGLFSVGLLTNTKEDIIRHLDNLVGTKTIKGLKDGDVFALKLEPDGVKNGFPLFKVTSPKSRMTVGEGKAYVMIPVPFYYHITNVLTNVFKSKAFVFEKATEFGNKRHVATFSADTVRRYYEDSPKEQIETKVMKTKVGFDVTNIRIKAYDLESSVNSLGVASFRPEMLNYIKATRINLVDKSMHNVTLDSVIGVYESKVKKFTVAQLKEVKFMDLSSYATAKDAQEALLLLTEKLNAMEIYKLMKQNPHLFGDINSSIANKEKAVPKVLKSLKLCELPEDSNEKVALIKDMLDKGVVKITAVSKSNKVYERLCSNNVEVLERFLGKDYVAKFESIKYRIKHVRDLVLNKQIKSKEELEKVAVEYDILSYVNSALLFDKSINKGFNGQAVQALDEVLGELSRKYEEKSRHRPETYMTLRNIKAKSNTELYLTIDANNITAVEFAEYVAPVSKSSTSQSTAKKQVKKTK